MDPVGIGQMKQSLFCLFWEVKILNNGAANRGKLPEDDLKSTLHSPGRFISTFAMDPVGIGQMMPSNIILSCNSMFTWSIGPLELSDNI